MTIVRRKVTVMQMRSVSSNDLGRKSLLTCFFIRAKIVLFVFTRRRNRLKSTRHSFWYVKNRAGPFPKNPISERSKFIRIGYRGSARSKDTLLMCRLLGDGVGSPFCPCVFCSSEGCNPPLSLSCETKPPSRPLYSSSHQLYHRALRSS